MSLLPNAILASRGSAAREVTVKPATTAPRGLRQVALPSYIMPPVSIPPVHPRGPPASGGAGAGAGAGASDSSRPRGRLTKEERAREMKKVMSARIAAFAETKPTRRAVREYFESRISELNEEKG